MIEKRVQDALNKQVNAELGSAYVYLAMSAKFEEDGLAGFAKWMRLQAVEEVKHAMKIFDHIHERDGAVALEAVAKPAGGWKTPRAAFEAALAHERKISGMIHDLHTLARKEDDPAAENLMRWFIDEQVEEEKTAADIVRTLERIGDDPRGLYLLDRELGTRAE